MAAAAYRAGVELHDERTGLTHDYRRKGGIEVSEVVMPEGGTIDRGALWNAGELAEKRKDGRTAREWIVALPAEIDGGARHALTKDFSIALARRFGVAVDYSVHKPDREGDNRNHHAHILTTTRQVRRGESGKPVLGDKATIELSDTKRKGRGLGAGADEIAGVRLLWEQLTNRALEKAGRPERIDARTLEAQGIDRAPTRHLGPNATNYERRTGEKSRRRVDFEREVSERLIRAKGAGEIERQRIADANPEVVKIADADIGSARVVRDQLRGDRPAPIKLSPAQIKARETLRPAPDQVQVRAAERRRLESPRPAGPQAKIESDAQALRKNAAGAARMARAIGERPGAVAAVLPEAGKALHEAAERYRVLRRGLAPDAAERRLGEDLVQEAGRLDRGPGPASLLTRIVLDVKRISAERERGRDQDQELER